MARTLGKLLLALLLVALSFSTASWSAHAEESPNFRAAAPKVLNLAVMGDSYSAGNGAGDYDHNPKEMQGNEGLDKAYVSRNNWGYKYREWLLSKGVDARLTVLAHSGHTTELLRETQVDNIPSDTDLVLLTIGGNDIGFGQVAEKCLAEGYRNPVDCKAAIESARRSFVILEWRA